MITLKPNPGSNLNLDTNLHWEYRLGKWVIWVSTPVQPRVHRVVGEIIWVIWEVLRITKYNAKQNSRENISEHIEHICSHIFLCLSSIVSRISNSAQNDNTSQLGLKLQKHNTIQNTTKPCRPQRLSAEQNKSRGLAEQSCSTEVATMNRFEMLGACDD